MVDPVKDLFARHLASIGFEFGASPQAILDKLRQRMGEKRFAEFQGRGGMRSTNSQEEAYSQFEDIIEGNLLRSLDKTATLDASYALYQKCARRLMPGTRIIELGCWTGGLASFIASRHPDCVVVGVDGAKKVIDACKAHYHLPNLTFAEWNYRWGKPETLEPADVLLCSMGVVHHLPDNSAAPDPASMRRTTDYLVQRGHAIGYFSIWRSAAKDGASFWAVLRVGLLARFLGWLDAAQKTGWTPRLDQIWHVDMPGESAPLPGLMFEARQCEPLDEDAVLDRYTWFHQRKDVYGRLEGGAALTAFRALQNRTVFGSRTYRREGALTRDEVGWAGGIGYAFTCDVVSQYRLLLLSHDRARQLAAAVSAKDFTTPINDDGLAQSPAVNAATFGGVFFSGPSPLHVCGNGDRI